MNVLVRHKQANGNSTRHKHMLCSDSCQAVRHSRGNNLASCIVVTTSASVSILVLAPTHSKFLKDSIHSGITGKIPWLLIHYTPSSCSLTTNNKNLLTVLDTIAWTLSGYEHKNNYMYKTNSRGGEFYTYLFNYTVLYHWLYS